MTKHHVKMLLKQAKETTLPDRLGVSPTKAGLLAGAGLGTTLASLGAVARAGQAPSEHSALTNPLLLGLLGGAGGYLAGNIYENTPVKRTPSLSTSSKLGLLGSAGYLGTEIAKNEGNALLNTERAIYNSIADGTKFDSLTERGKQEFVKYEQDFIKALKRSGNFEEAYALEKRRGLTETPTLWRKIKDRLRYSSLSPVRWIEAVKNSTKAGLGPNTALRKVLSSKRGRIAALVLAAGAGKGVYDYLRD